MLTSNKTFTTLSKSLENSEIRITTKDSPWRPRKGKGILITNNLLNINENSYERLLNNLKNNKKFDINRNKIQDKYDVIYCRFFLHAIDENSEDKLINLIKDAKKKQTLVFFEFRNNKDKIFKKFKKKMNTNLYEFEKGHFRRIIDPKAFQKKFLFKKKFKIIYEKSGKNFSIIKNDNPNLSRMIFKF